MGKPKKQTSRRKRGFRRSHVRGLLAKRVNARSSVKVLPKRKTAKKTSK